MKINNITPYNINTHNKNKNTYQRPKNLISSNELAATPQYINFAGGYSLDLAKTIQRLDILAINKPRLYPPNIREWAGMILKEGNKTNETLIDIHKKFYNNLKECFSLQEVKEKFPEFKNVISDTEIEFNKGSFMEAFKKGELECFDKDEDLSLQLIKLYWGDDFSLTDLQKYTKTLEQPNGCNLAYTMHKLNIPLADRDYGHILKFSDAEYNSRLIKEMALRRLETMDKKAQLADGEPVFIKRGAMSAEHKEHISQGLLKYYQENPERLYQISERQKEFYQKNPERADILGRVATKAWYIFGADKIKNALSKFMKSNGVKDFTENDLENPISFSKHRALVMKKFWGTNEWAKKSFSKNMEYAWKKVKAENEMFYMANITPKGFKEKFYKWAEQKGIDTTDLNFEKSYYPHKPELNNFDTETLSKYTRMFVDSSTRDESSLMANTYFLTLLNFNREISKMNLIKSDIQTQKIVQMFKDLIKESLFVSKDKELSKNQFKSLDAQEIQSIFSFIQKKCMDNHKNNFLNILNTNLDKSYEYIDKIFKPNSHINFSPYGKQF